MIKKRIVLLGLCLIVASGISLAILRLTSYQTILNPSWYKEIRSDIYYVERMTEQLNLQIKTLMEHHDYPLGTSRSFISTDNLNYYLNMRSDGILKITKEDVEGQLRALNDFIRVEIEQMVHQTFKVIEQRQTNPIDDQHDVLKAEIIELISNHLIKIEKINNEISMTNWLNDLMFLTTHHHISILIIMFVMIFFIGMYVLCRLNLIKLFFYLGISTCMSGIGFIILYYVSPLLNSKLLITDRSLQQEFQLFGMTSILKFLFT